MGIRVRRIRRAPAGAALLAACLLAGIPTRAAAQDIEPRTYFNAPIGINFLIAGYVYTQGALQFDSALEITDPDLRTSNAVLAYARVFEPGGKPARVGGKARMADGARVIGSSRRGGLAQAEALPTVVGLGQHLLGLAKRSK